MPPNVKSFVATNLKKDNNDTAIWNLADDGWRKVLGAYRQKVLDEYVGRLNTPKPEIVEQLFERLIGFRHLPSYWYWTGNSAQQSKERLVAFIEYRGAIAHRTKAANKIRKSYVKDHRAFVYRLAVISTNRVNGHLARTLRQPKPWLEIRFGSVR